MMIYEKSIGNCVGERARVEYGSNGELEKEPWQGKDG
jgi:hypothetical protein